MASTDLFYPPTTDLLHGATTTSFRLANGLHISETISRNTMSFPSAEERTLFHSPTAARVSGGAAMEVEARRINNLRVPPRLGGNQRQLTHGCHQTFNSIVSEPHSQPQGWLSADEAVIHSPTAAFLQPPRDDWSHRTLNGLRVPRPIGHRRQTTASITNRQRMLMSVQDIQALGILQERPPNIVGRAIDFRRKQSFQTAIATHIHHANPNDKKNDESSAETRQVQLCTLIDIAIDRLHNPFTNEDRQVLRQILGYLDQRRYELVVRRISVDSNAPQVTVPETWVDVADLAFEAIRTVDYPYLLRVMEAIDILSSGSWYNSPEEEEMNKENIPLGFI